MSLLSVTVKKARYVSMQGVQQFNTYVTLKLQNVKSTTVTVKGPTPCWEQDFLFEINDINLGLLVEVWNKGVIWDKALGYHYLPLTSVAYNESDGGGRWVELEAQVMMRGGAVVGTTGPTGNALLLDCRFEPPFDAEGTGGADLQRKLDLLNGTLDAERAEQARRQMQYIAHSGYSEDSDYTSDLNYPVGQHANCSASQFRNHAHQMHTPQRSLEVSRENSYERDEYHIHGDTDPLYYNSQPRTNRIDTWSQLHAQVSVESAISWRTAADWPSGEEQRRPSLERQNTLYDDSMPIYGFETYGTSITHTRDHSHLSQQASYEEFYDSSSYPYQTSYVGDDSRQWDSGGGGQYFFDDGQGLTPTEYENVVNKRRSSVVQLPQVPPKPLVPSSRYSDYNEMAPYRPRPRRSAASLPATPSSTPKRGRALPVPPGSESGSTRGSRGRRLPQPPTPMTSSMTSYGSFTRPRRAPSASTLTHVPYVPEPEKPIPDVSYGYDSFGFQQDFQDTATEPYQDTNYNNTTYDSDGMQPFFDETPHATPPAAAQKTPWTETETISQFTYPITSEIDALLPKTVPSTLSSYLPQLSVATHQQDLFQGKNYPDVDSQYEEQQYRFNQQDQQFPEQSQYDVKQQHQQDYQQEQQHLQDYQQEPDYQQQRDYEQQQDYKYDSQFESQYPEEEKQPVSHQIFTQQFEQDQQYLQDQQYFQHDELQKAHQLPFQQQQQQDLQFQQQQQQLQFQQQQQQQQQQLLLQQQQQHLLQQQQHAKQPAQQLQTSVIAGAATLGSFMAGSAKKLGSFFGAAAAAVSAPAVSQPPHTVPAKTAPISHFASSAPFTCTVSATTSVPEMLPSVPVSTVTVTTSASVSLPRTPSLRRQESIQRPSVRRTRTLPDAPEELTQPSFDESAYEDEYNKTEYDQTIDRDRTSLDRYRDDDFIHDTILEEVPDERRLSEAPPSPSLQKQASPTRTMTQIRKPSVDSYHSQTPSIVDRRTSQSSFHPEEKLAVPTTQEDSLTDKTKVTFQEERTTYHEVPEVTDGFHEAEPLYDDNVEEYRDVHDTYQGDTFREEREKFDDQEPFQETDEPYQEEDSVFREGQDRPEEDRLEFQPEQPKLTPRQRWHRAYNKIVMKLNN